MALAYRVDPSGGVALIPDSLCVTVEALASGGAALSREARRAPEGLVHRVLQSQRVTWVANLASDPTYPPERRAAMVGLLGACGVPVVHDGRVVAVLEFLSAEPLVPSPSRAALLESIGGLAGMARAAAR